MKLKCGFLGIGAMGRSHVDLFHNQCGERAEAVAICGRNEDNIKKALEHAPNAKVFNDESELIQSDLDAVVVSTPNFTHLKWAKEIVESGKHLFLEKPCGISMEQTYELVALANSTDKVVMVGHELRYSPFFQKMKEMVDAGEIGTPHMVWTKEFRDNFQPKSGQWIQDDRKSGGCLVDKNCHHFDMMNWWVGARPKYVAAFGSNAVNRVIEGEHQVHDNATVSFEYDSGVKGTLHLCMFARDFPHEELEMGIIGDKGSLQTSVSTIEILQWKQGSGNADPIRHKTESKAGVGWGGHLGFSEIHDAFVEAALDGKPVLTGVNDCVDGTRMCIAGEQSIREKRIVKIQ
ncbi:MAG: putative dehydrogenase [Candidatus Binatia bacterium]|jgi:predicted dehydrogenase